MPWNRGRRPTDSPESRQQSDDSKGARGGAAIRCSCPMGGVPRYDCIVVMTADAPPLSGVTVIDLGQIYQGPYATFLMARAGADVIKVEPPRGEALRARELRGEGPSFPLAFLNSNKRGVTLNLKAERGKDLLRRMVSRADVLLENFAPGTMDRLGVGAEELLAANPRLIYASGSGFGLSGPDRDRLAMDITVQASAGVMSITGMPDGPPIRSGPALADFLGGTHLYGAVMTALFERERTGRGRLVEVAMQETVYPSLLSDLGLQYRGGGKQLPRRGNHHGTVAPYNVYETNDGHVALLCISNEQWGRLLRAMGREDLEGDPRFSDGSARCDHLEETDRVVEQWTRALSREDVYEAAQHHRVPCAPVRDLDEVTNDPHMHERGMLRWVEHPVVGRVVLPDSPIRLHDSASPELIPSPTLGQHNIEVYRDWLGLSAAELDTLRADGVI